MFAQPPFTEFYLQQEHAKSRLQTECISTIRSQIQTDREVNQCSHYGLGYIVRKTHFSIESQAADGILLNFSRW